MGQEISNTGIEIMVAFCLNVYSKCYMWCINSGHGNLQWEVQEADKNTSQHQWPHVESDIYLLINTSSRFEASGTGSYRMGLCSLWSQWFPRRGTVSSIEEYYTLHLKPREGIVCWTLWRQMRCSILAIIILGSHDVCQKCKWLLSHVSYDHVVS